MEGLVSRVHGSIISSWYAERARQRLPSFLRTSTLRVLNLEPSQPATTQKIWCGSKKIKGKQIKGKGEDSIHRSNSLPSLINSFLLL